VPELDRRQLVVLAVLAVVVAGLGLRLLDRAGQPPASGVAARAPAVRLERSVARVTVHVAGAVRRPGLYRLRAGSRVDDALRRAGGARRGADLDALNLAAEVEDGRQVLVPERAPPAGAAGAAGSAAAPAPAPAPGHPLNLNTATLEQLDTLEGVGPATAEKILAYREEHGGFGKVDELGQIPGIGEKRLASLREQVTV
jgi:competence protein ComEA